MKTFITGATGYIGNALMRSLIRQGHEINILVRNSGKKEWVSLPGVNLFDGDIMDKNAIDKAMKGCQQVYHVAGFARLWSASSEPFFSVNIKGTHNVLSVAAENNISKLVYTSSAAVLGSSVNVPLMESDPRVNALTNDYDLSKHMAEEIVRTFAAEGLDAVIVNPSRVFGPGALSHSNAMSRMLIRFLNSNFCWAPGCLQVISNYAYIDDVLRGHQLAMHNGVRGERYILGGENASYAELYKLIEEITGKKLSFRIPAWLMKGAGYLQLIKYHLSGIEPEFTPGTIKRFLHNAALSSDKAIRELGYRITPLKTGLEVTIETLKKNNHGNAYPIYADYRCQ